jgi:hypothetical protein
LDVLIGDTAILDYFRANDPGCHLNLLGDAIFDDAYAVAMQKGFPLKVQLSFKIFSCSVVAISLVVSQVVSSFDCWTLLTLLLSDSIC